MPKSLYWLIILLFIFNKSSVAIQKHKIAQTDTPVVKTYVMTMPKSNDNNTDVIINVISGFVGVIIGALLPYFMAERQSKKNNTFEFYHEFNSVEMSMIRHDAWELIKIYPKATIDQLLEHDSKRANDLLIVSRFYQKLNYSLVNKRLIDDLLFELFAENFYYWYYGYFEDMNGLNEWPNGKNLKLLSHELKKIAGNRHVALMNHKRQEVKPKLGLQQPESNVRNI